MKWLTTFVEAIGFQVVATFNAPETLSAGDITNLVNTAQSEGVALIVDNLQIDVEFGKGIATQVGVEHVILTKFPGALPGTENLATMYQYIVRVRCVPKWGAGLVPLTWSMTTT